MWGKKNSSIGKKCIWGNQTCRLQTGREKQRQKWKTSHTHTRTTYTHTWKGSFCLGIASMEKEEILGATPGSQAHRQSTKSCNSHTEIQHLRKDAQKNTHTDHIPYVAGGVYAFDASMNFPFYGFQMARRRRNNRRLTLWTSCLPAARTGQSSLKEAMEEMRPFRLTRKKKLADNFHSWRSLKHIRALPQSIEEESQSQTTATK